MGRRLTRAGGLAVDQHDALVALRHVGQERLHHERLAPDLAEQFGQRGEVGVLAADMEHRRAGIAVERLDHDLAMLGMEGARILEPAGDQRRRHELGIIEHEQLFGRVAHRRGIVDHQRAVADALEQVGGGDVGEIERRILPHQHDIDILGEIERLPLAIGMMRARDALDRDRAGRRHDAAVAIAEIAGDIMEQPVPARLRRRA